MYVTGPWSVVYALDARTGKLRWQYDPKVPRRHALDACCGVVNRGVAAENGRIFVGTLDGRLVALEATTGKLVWETLTVDPDQPYSITGAPRVVAGRVVIGNGGAEYGVRGYVSAYDAETGELDWRTYTVPGDPAKPFESKAMERAASTWSGDGWKLGGGGTAWDAMAYDPALDLLYVGTGNGGPYPIWTPQPGWRRQPLSLVDPRAAPCDGRARLAFPDDARRFLGLHRDPAHDPRRPRDRRSYCARS